MARTLAEIKELQAELAAEKEDLIATSDTRLTELIAQVNEIVSEIKSTNDAASVERCKKVLETMEQFTIKNLTDDEKQELVDAAFVHCMKEPSVLPHCGVSQAKLMGYMRKTTGRSTMSKSTVVDQLKKVAEANMEKKGETAVRVYWKLK